MVLVKGIKDSLRTNPKVYLSLFIPVAITLGALVVFAFPPYDFYGYIFVPYLLLFWLIYRYPPLHVFYISFAYGCGEFFHGMPWVYSFGSWVDPQYLYSIATINTIILLIFLFLGTAMPALLSSLWLKYVGRYFGILALTLIFTLSEWVRSFAFTGLPYFQPGLLFVDTPLANLAPFAGLLSVTFAFFLLVALSVFILSKSFLDRRFSSLFIAVIITVGLLVVPLIEVSRDGEQIVARVIHGASTNADKKVGYKQADRIKHYFEFSKALPTPDIALWPEGTIQGGNRLLGRVSRQAKEIQKNVGTNILLGAYVKDKGHTYNALIRADNLRTLYDKVHLIPFGEYTPNLSIPFLNIDSHLPDINNDSLTKGSKNQKVAHVDKYVLRVGICFEIIFGDDIRRTEADYDFFANISDLSWFLGTPVKYHTLQMARMRAMELSKPVLRSTNYGVSAIIDHKGKVLVENDTEKEGYLDTKIVLQQGQTLYVRFGNSPLLFLLFVTLLLILLNNIVKVRSLEKFDNF